jgi:hypothetical protein
MSAKALANMRGRNSAFGKAMTWQFDGGVGLAHE